MVAVVVVEGEVVLAGDADVLLRLAVALVEQVLVYPPVPHREANFFHPGKCDKTNQNPVPSSMIQVEFSYIHQHTDTYRINKYRNVKCIKTDKDLRL